MTVTTPTSNDRHLSLVATITDASEAARAAQQSLTDVTRMFVRYAVGTPLDEQSAAVVLDYLTGLDADHQTACDVLDLAAADVDQARKELSEAARRLADAEERWARAGIVADETSRAAIAAREAAGVTLTATGYTRNGDGR